MAWNRKFLGLLLPLIVLGLVLRFFFVQSLVVRTDRFDPLLLQGDFVVGLKSLSPHRGDLVSYNCMERGVCIGRVLGAEGDRLDFDERKPRVRVNEKHEMPLALSDATQLKTTSFVVHPEHFFIEGDQSGEISAAQVQSVLSHVLISVDPAEGRVRWSRFWFPIH
jgi:signal peptidase I